MGRVNTLARHCKLFIMFEHPCSAKWGLKQYPLFSRHLTCEWQKHFVNHKRTAFISQSISYVQIHSQSHEGPWPIAYQSGGP